MCTVAAGSRSEARRRRRPAASFAGATERSLRCRPHALPHAFPHANSPHTHTLLPPPLSLLAPMHALAHGRGTKELLRARAQPYAHAPCARECMRGGTHGRGEEGGSPKMRRRREVRPGPVTCRDPYRGPYYRTVTHTVTRRDVTAWPRQRRHRAASSGCASGLRARLRERSLRWRPHPLRLRAPRSPPPRPPSPPFWSTQVVRGRLGSVSARARAHVWKGVSTHTHLHSARA